MKRMKMPVIALLIVICALFVSCSKDGGASIADYFPLTGDRLMHFEGTATVRTNSGETEHNLYSVQFLDYFTETKAQRRTMMMIDSSQSCTGEVYELVDGVLKITYIQDNFLDHSNLFSAGDNYDLTILKEPLQKDASWTRHENGAYKETAKIVSMNEKVIVPYGTFDAMVVEVTNNLTDEKSLEYYVQGLGCVRIDNDGSDLSQTQQLTKVEDGPLTEYTEIFYGWEVVSQNDELGKPHYFHNPLYDTVPFEYNTNADPLELYVEWAAAYLKERFAHDLDPGVRINEISLDRFNRILYVDMSSEFLTEMAKAGADEPLALQLAADNIGWLYNAFEVVFVIEGGAYVSDNVDLALGQSVLMTMYQDLTDYQPSIAE